jgi:hypothetical protein
MDELADRLRDLPLQREMVLQGDIFPSPQLVQAQEGSPIRPRFGLWTEVESGLAHLSPLILPDEDGHRALLEALVGFVEKYLEGQVCPSCLEVRDSQLAEYLRERLRATSIEVRLVDRLPTLEAARQSLSEFLARQHAEPPGLMDVPSMTVERILSFAEAAAAYYRARPWRHLTDLDLLEIESPMPPHGLRAAVVLGAGRTLFGLGLYCDVASYRRFAQAGQSGDNREIREEILTQVAFDGPEDLSARDAELWHERALPVAGPRAYPLVMKFGGDTHYQRPSTQELTFLEGLLWALAATSEAEIDSGRWSKEVTTHDGQTEYTLALPDLLERPSRQQWYQRGFEPDRRAHERIFADMNRYLRDHPPASEKDLEAMNRLLAGRSLDDPLIQPPNAPRNSATRPLIRTEGAAGNWLGELSSSILIVPTPT